MYESLESHLEFLYPFFIYSPFMFDFLYLFRFKRWLLAMFGSFLPKLLHLSNSTYKILVAFYFQERRGEKKKKKSCVFPEATKEIHRKWKLKSWVQWEIISLLSTFYCETFLVLYSTPIRRKIITFIIVREKKNQNQNQNVGTEGSFVFII